VRWINWSHHVEKSAKLGTRDFDHLLRLQYHDHLVPIWILNMEQLFMPSDIISYQQYASKFRQAGHWAIWRLQKKNGVVGPTERVSTRFGWDISTTKPMGQFTKIKSDRILCDNVKTNQQTKASQRLNTLHVSWFQLTVLDFIWFNSIALTWHLPDFILPCVFLSYVHLTNVFWNLCFSQICWPNLDGFWYIYIYIYIYT
jgi:hypothetical protein